jgi:2-polyprenyl-3-methyl-5-hydroxy-6-metoxy-1,4-benzoquinol methylase
VSPSLGSDVVRSQVVAGGPAECEVCASTDFARLFALPMGEGQCFQCSRCGVVRLETEREADYCEEGYIECIVRQAMSGGRLHEWTMDRIETHHPERGVLVEVGCGIGTQLAVARRRGWDVWGYDINQDCPPIAHHLHRIQVRCENFLQVSERDAADVVLMCQFIEHVTDPRPFLAASRRILRRNGLLVVATPNWNFASPFAWAATRLGAPMPRIDHIVPRHHLRLYRPGTMRVLAERNGWDVVAKYDNPTDYLGNRSVASLRSATGLLGRMLARVSGNRLLVGMNMLVILRPQVAP